MYIVVEKLKEYDKEYGYDMRLKGFEQMEDAIIWAITAPLRCDFPLCNYNDVYESNVYELGEKNIMKITTNFTGTYINAKANTGKNGNTYYQMSIDCNGDAGSISCTEEVYNLCQTGAVERFRDYEYIGELNTQYGSFRIRDVKEV